MSIFAAYDLHPHRLEVSFLLRRSTAADWEGIGNVMARRYNEPPHTYRAWLEKNLNQSERPWWVATVAQQIRGSAYLGYFEPPEQAPQNCVPAGWYLYGLTVDPQVRRAGIGTALCQIRLDWLREKGLSEAWFFANSQNLASITLHAKCGFTQIQKGIWYPGAHFSQGGTGMLYHTSLLPTAHV